MTERIASVGVAVVRVPLPQPVVYRDWVVRDRTFAVAGVRTTTGAVGHAYGLTRDGPVAAIIRELVAPVYTDADLTDPYGLFRSALGRSRPVLAGGVGLRALSLVDIATWSVAATVTGRSMRRHLGGSVAWLPVMGIAGYPHALGVDAVAEQAQRWAARGVPHLKLPAVADLARDRERMSAAAPHADMVSLDGGWTIDRVEDGVALAAAMPRPGWLEDPVPPDRIDLMAELRRATPVRLAMGDEQGGPGFPDALLLAGGVDVIRLDATCVGGISGLQAMLPRIRTAGVGVSFHVFARQHAQIAAALDVAGAVIEWSLPGMVVDPITESLPMPVMTEGGMAVTDERPGLGPLWDPSWMSEQTVEDPDGVLAW